MARRYAAVLGMLAFAAILVRGIAAGGAANSVLTQAICYLVVFAAAGGFIGALAQWIVEDSVRSKLTVEMAERRSAPAKKPAVVAGNRS